MIANPHHSIDRPTFLSAAGSPTAVSNGLASCALLACLFLPHSVGVDGKPCRPISVLNTAIRDGGESTIAALVALWPFGLAFGTLIVFFGLVIFRPMRTSLVLFLLPSVFAMLLSFLWIVYLFSGTKASRDAMAMVAIIAPFTACVVARMVWLYRLEKISAAASWGQSWLCLLAAFSLRWNWWQRIESLAWGGYVSIVSVLVMLVASWTWFTRGGCDLSDHSVAPIGFRVSLRRAFVVITAMAIAFTYWQMLSRWRQ